MSSVRSPERDAHNSINEEKTQKKQRNMEAENAKRIEKEQRQAARKVIHGSKTKNNSQLDRLDASIAAKMQKKQSRDQRDHSKEALKGKTAKEEQKNTPRKPVELERLDAKIDAKTRNSANLNSTANTKAHPRTSAERNELESLDSAIRAKVRTRDEQLEEGFRARQDHATGIVRNHQADENEHDPTEITATIVNEQDIIDEENRRTKVAEDRIRQELKANTPKAEIVESTTNRCDWKMIIGCGCVVLVMLILAITLGTTLSKDTTPVPEIVQYLQTLSSEQSLRYPLPSNDPTSAEYALDWFGQQQETVKLPTTSKDEILLLQAFVLTTLWFQSTKENLEPVETIQGCQWFPMECDDDTGEIVELYLGEFALEGTIPKDLGSLTKLSVLNIQRNSLTGNLPSELGSLSMLTNLLLFDNALWGTFPTEIGGLTNLQRLEFGGNQFSGPLPTELGLLTQLISLSFEENPFSGQIPTELARLTNLPSLTINHNAFTGTIPTEFAEMTSLRVMTIIGTNVGGSIPSLLPQNVHFLLLWNNNLTGTIPTELGLLTSMTVLSLANNLLDSTIPTELGSLTALAQLVLGGNRLRQPFPSELLTGLPNLSTLRLDDSGLSGPIAAILGSWTSTLQVLDVSSNEFEGTIPTELATYTLLKEFYLARNADITGSIPSDLAVLTDMERFDISSCPQLVGSIPPELMAWADISWALVNNTGLTGVFPWCNANFTEFDLFVADCPKVQCDCCHNDECKDSILP